jgi:hypothetical protein
MDRNWWFPVKAKGHNSADFSNSHTPVSAGSIVFR